MGPCRPRLRTVAEFLRLHVVHWEEKFHALRFRQREDLVREVELVRFHAALAGRDALRLEERVSHRAGDEEDIGLFHQRFDDADLVGDLRAAEDYEKGARGTLEFA